MQSWYLIDKEVHTVCLAFEASHIGIQNMNGGVCFRENQLLLASPNESVITASIFHIKPCPRRLKPEAKFWYVDLIPER